MEQTIVTLLIAAGGAVFGVLVIAGGYLAARAAVRDANGVLHKAPTPEPDLYSGRPEPPRRSGAKPERLDPIRVQQAMILELQRTRSILLGWLSVLEAFALGDAWRATALRSELGDINTCDVSLVGDANVIATYQLTVDMLRNQAGRGLPPDVASQMASIRVRLLTALAEQERRLNHGERPLIAEPLGHLDLWGPPRPITEVITRPPADAPPRPALSGGSGSPAPTAPGDRLPSYPPPPPAQPLVIRSVAPTPPTAPAPTPGATEDPSRLIASTTSGAPEGQVLIAPTSTASPASAPSQPVGDQPVRADVATEPTRSAAARALRTPEGSPKSSSPKSSSPKSSSPKSSSPKSSSPNSSGLKTSKPAPRNPAAPSTGQPVQTPRAAAPVRARPAAPSLPETKLPAKQPEMRASSRPMLRALPDPSGSSRRSSTTRTTDAPAPAPIQAAPSKQATPPVAATKAAGPPAGKRPTPAVAKPAAPSPRKPASSASGPIGPAAMSAKPVARSTARRSEP